MVRYETLFVLHPDLPEAQVRETIDRVRRLIEGMGKVVRVNPPGVKDLVPGMGVEFVNFDDESMALIQEICASRSGTRN